MSYRLYNRDGSGGFVVEAALALAETPFELILLDSVPSTPLDPSFRDINPRGQVPVLILPDGSMMTESAAILIHLSHIFPDKKLAPPVGTADHGQFLRWLIFLSVNIYEGELHRGYPDRYGTAGVVEAATERMHENFAILEARLEGRDFLLGDEMSLADVYLAMLTSWLGAGSPFARCVDLTHRVARHPVIAPIWQRNFDHRAAAKWGRDDLLEQGS